MLVWPPSEILRQELDAGRAQLFFVGYDKRLYASIKFDSYLTDDEAIDMLSPLARDILIEAYAAEARGECVA